MAESIIHNPTELTPLLHSARAFLLDIDGVLYQDGRAIPGAAELLDRFTRQGVPYLCLTNTSYQCRASVAEKLAAVGLNVAPDRIFTAPLAARAFILEQAGRTCWPVVTPDTMRDFEGLPVDEENPDFVILGDLWHHFDYATLNRIFHRLIRGAGLVAMHRSRFWRTADDLQLDMGAFVAGLEYAAAVEPVIAGKPSPLFFQTALARLEVSPAEALMIGDDFEGDVLGAEQAGVTGVLVQTGKYDPQVLTTLGHQPTRLIGSVADILEVI